MYSRVALLIIGPLLLFLSYLIPEDIATSNMHQVLALALWMVIWWVSEIIPVPATALLPLVILPFIGVFKIVESTAPYANPIIFLFMGGFMIALAMEKHKLHLRIALNILKITGTSGNGIILGFMISTALLSMWISNTATAVMMLPVAISVIDLLKKNSEDLSDSYRPFALVLMLCIAYAANIGGTMTLIGTPPNIVMAGYTRELLDTEIPFGTWMIIAVPIGILLLGLCYTLLTRVLFVNKLQNVEGSKELINNKLKEIGEVSFEEKGVITIFLMTALGWIFKAQINGLIGENLLSDTTTAMTGGLLMFIFPSNLKKKKFLLQWEDMLKLPWGILILFGGGMCLAKALESVGLIQTVGELVSSMNIDSTFLLVLIITVLVLFMTELMSNVALVTIFIPVAIGIANGLDINPLILVIPATIASSCAFMMPISTPPNAVVFSSGYVRMKEMIRAGWILNLVSSVVISVICYLLLEQIF